MKMNNKTYDILKFVALIVLPALGTLYGALANIWGFPYGEQILGTIAAVEVFLGAVLGISSSKYYKTGKDTVGTVSVNPETDEVDFNFEEMSAKELSEMKQVKIKVETYEGKHEKADTEAK